MMNGLGKRQQIVQNDGVPVLHHFFKFAQLLNAQRNEFKGAFVQGVLLPGMDKANISLVAVDVNDATNGRVVFDKGPRTVENFLQKMGFTGIAGTGD
jgi:hypothetical protein